MITLNDFLAEFKKGGSARSILVRRSVSCGYILHRLLKETGRPVFLLCDTDRTMQELYDDLRFFSSNIRRFPPLDVVPYGKITPQQDILGERIGTAYSLGKAESSICLSTVRAVMEPFIPPDLLSENYLYLVEGEEASFTELKSSLPRLGYQVVENVEMLGECSFKGGVIDVFTPNYPWPLRFDFFGDLVESIRFFNPQDQRTVNKAAEGVVLPVRDFIFSNRTVTEAMVNLKQYADDNDIPKRLKDGISESIANGIYLPGIEFLLPVLYGRKTTVLDHLKEPVICLYSPEDIERERKALDESIEKAYMFYRERDMFIVRPDDVFGRGNIGVLDSRKRISLDRFAKEETTMALEFEDNSEIEESRRTQVAASREAESHQVHPIRSLARIINEKSRDFRTLIVSSGRAQSSRMKELLEFYGLSNTLTAGSFEEFEERAVPGDLFLTHGRPLWGFRSYSERLWLITEEEIFGMAEKKKAPKKREIAEIISSLYELKEGDLVVHVDNGVGIYRGLKQVSVLGRTGEFIEIEYADSAKLFVPVDKIGLVQKFIASEDHIARIDRLGDRKWQKSKKKVKEDLRKLAEEIVGVEAARKTGGGNAFVVDRHGLDEFSAVFEFDETEDQKKAIDEVIKDMESEKPMDRIICGDVGFGKTEVAIRAAFVAVQNRKQVAVVAPTTILAEQHWDLFRKRFEPFGYEVRLLSRFVEPAEQKRVVEQLRSGKAEIVIGTHRLLAKDVAFADLGLLIIDEEHKFGVTQKEKVKKMKASVDVLTLTATPIPRTLHMSLSGLRDISLITSPPEGRLSIRTYVTRYSRDIIKEAVEREIQRGGQVFFMHNRVRSIFAARRHMESLFPNLSIEVAHGRMEEDELQRVMDDFKKGAFQILVCTSIIESGLDLPNVNTIIINRADKFGLADLYQLRGRVGRSNKRAYAYLMIPSFDLITKDALKRLRALQELEELGSGFRLAIHDLEIRGAGDLLGRKQSGHINEIGMELYMQLLDETVREIKFEKGETLPQDRIDVDLTLPLPSYIPEQYMPSSRERLNFYKKILGSRTAEELDLVEEELRDRFGAPPAELSNFFYQKLTELHLANAGVSRCYLSNDRLVIVYDLDHLPPLTVLKSVSKNNRNTKYVPPEKLYIFLESRGRDISEIKKVLHGFIESAKLK